MTKLKAYMAFHKLSSGDGVHRVGQVVRIHHWKGVTNEIGREAKGFDLAWVDVWQSLTLFGVTK